jgi:acetyl-CoA carboxylase biotin carboxyl carrier protein
MEDERQADKGKPPASSLDVEAVRQLLSLMSEHDLTELEIEQGDTVVRLRKAGAAAPAVSVMPVPAPMMSVLPQGAAAAPAPAAAAKKEESLPSIKSPMVGTFYVSSSPEAQPYVKVGDHVSEDTVVCIIEAMKVFNEIRAETSGIVERILVKNAQAVEFGQALFVVRPE